MLTVKENATIVGVAEIRKVMKEVLEALEDSVLGNTAAERAKRKDRKWVTLDEAEKKLGLR